MNSPINSITRAVERAHAKFDEACASFASRAVVRGGAIAREQGNGQSHTLEIVVAILIVVVLGIFFFKVVIPAIEGVVNGAMTNVGSIVPTA